MHTTWFRTAVGSSLLLLAAAEARADEGMWLFNNPPKQAIQQKYGFDLTAQWLDQVQKSCVRFSTGGSGSIVSPEGLVMTNHHVGADMVSKLSTAERDYLESGFYAPTHAQELACPDLELLVLWNIEDQTARVNAAAKSGQSVAEAGKAKREEISRIEKEMSDSTGLKCEMVTLYQGARYHIYCYKRYTDVRLVFAPEKQAAFFGGDPDNFEFPRYNIDVTFFRIYENGAPLKAEHYLPWSPNGAQDGELVFVAGHPGSTERLNTVAHLEYFRDVRYPKTLARFWRREVQLTNFSQRSEEWRRIAEESLFGIQNSRKAITGRLEGLNDPAIMGPKLEAERQLQAFVRSNPANSERWGDAWGKIADAQHVAAANYDLNGALAGPGSKLFGYARTLVRAAEELPKESSQRLREFGDAGLPTLKQQLFSTAPVYADLEVDNVHSWLLFLSETLGGNHPLTVRALGGKAPAARAEELVRSSVLFDAQQRQKLFEGGAAALATSKDPLLALAKAIDADARALRKKLEDEVDSVLRENYAKIAEAKFAMEGDSVYPDATFTLRLSYGQVKGYSENGKDVPPFTTIEGKFERSLERDNQPPFDLPKSWVEASAKLKMDTPYNFVSTNDIIGGNSGSPTINKQGEVVGLIFDGNLQSLVGAISYSDQQARSVSVDSRGILEAVKNVYGAKELAAELTGKLPRN